MGFLTSAHFDQFAVKKWVAARGTHQNIKISMSVQPKIERRGKPGVESGEIVFQLPMIMICNINFANICGDKTSDKC